MKTEQYGILSKKVGSLLRLRVESNGEYNWCGETSVTFVDPNWGDDYPEYLVNDLSTALYALTIDTPGHNSSLTKPQHGCISMEYCEIVKVIKEFIPVEVEMPVDIFKNRETLNSFSVQKRWMPKLKLEGDERKYSARMLKGKASKIKVGDRYFNDHLLDTVVKVYELEELPAISLYDYLAYEKIEHPHAYVIIGKRD